MPPGGGSGNRVAWFDDTGALVSESYLVDQTGRPETPRLYFFDADFVRRGVRVVPWSRVDLWARQLV
jgi:hypothetical protein